MKRLFPRSVREASSLLGRVGLVIVVTASCSPDQGVAPGAPVLTQLTIVEGGSTPTDITSDTAACKADVKAGGDCRLVDNVVEGVTVDAKDTVCQLEPAVWCRCQGDATMTPTGAWNCDPFSPMSVVVATFDRLLDTDPLDPGDASFRTDIATLTAMPTPAKPIETDVDYSSTGSAKGVVFNVFGPMYFNNFRSAGPSLQIVGSPALETGATITVTLDPTRVRAKDGKTQFTGSGLLKDGTLAFKTAAFGASTTVPTQPPPDAAADGGDMDAEAGADGGVMADAAAPEVGADAALAEAGVDAALAEAGIDAALAEAGVDAAPNDAGASDTPASDAAPSDAAPSDAMADAAPIMPPTPGLPVGADMNMGPVTITFNNLVDATDIVKHIQVTENGVSFADGVTIDASKAPVVTITPKTMWAAGKTYAVIIDADAADVVGDTLGATAAEAASASFMMAN